MLTKEDIKKFGAQLTKDIKRLNKEIKELETPTDFGDDIGDKNEEEADEDEELENRGAAADELKKRRADDERALLKIREGKYGICENCGNHIEKEVLQAAPESRLCRNCKQNV
ncbi:MAG: TraR/DksA C4-type zinc finger protein [Candidatus Colwellbacteria bacterium]|nr:TraR/DksA C4-type zinc finger protein [Candidatus Colwellbacteria bacterium]